MKLLIDMNLSPDWVTTLKQAGYEAVHWIEIGIPTARDSEIMAYATANGYVVITHDLDFGIILATTGQVKPSVIQIRAEDLSPDKIGSKMIAAIRQSKDALEIGALLTVYADKMRLRLLPFISTV